MYFWEIFQAYILNIKKKSYKLIAQKTIIITNTHMKIKIYSIIASTFIACISFAQSSHQTVEELMQKSGSTGIFQQFDEMTASKIAEKRSLFQNDEDFNKFSTAMKSGFSSKDAEKFFMEYFERNTNEDSLKSVIKIYNNQFMQDMNKLETEASSPAKQQDQLLYFQGLAENPPTQERLNQLITLNNELGTSEMVVSILNNIMISMAKGLNEVQPKDKQISMDELEQKIKSSLPADFGQQMTNQIIAVALYTYKDVSNEKLNKYIAVWQTPTAKYFSSNTLKALDYTFSEMSKNMGKSLNSFVK